MCQWIRCIGKKIADKISGVLDEISTGLTEEERIAFYRNKGVLTHRLSYPIGFLPMLFIPNIYVFSIAFPVAIVNFF